LCRTFDVEIEEEAETPAYFISHKAVICSLRDPFHEFYKCIIWRTIYPLQHRSSYFSPHHTLLPFTGMQTGRTCSLALIHRPLSLHEVQHFVYAVSSVNVDKKWYWKLHVLEPNVKKENLPAYLPTYLLTHLSTYISIHLSIHPYLRPSNAFLKTTVRNNVSVLEFIVRYLLHVSAPIGGHLQKHCCVRWF
jgi:hypothetical protein